MDQKRTNLIWCKQASKAFYTSFRSISNSTAQVLSCFYCTTAIASCCISKDAAEDNPDLRQQKLSKDIESLSKLKGAKLR